MDRQLESALIATAAGLPYVIEVLRQVPLLTRVMRALPPDVRDGLPPHPRRAGLAVFGSARFFVALFRYALRKNANDGPEMQMLKGRMRASAVREGTFALLFAATVTLLWRHGWRPFG
ncbi:MAG: hypothetical protein ABUR63_00200 [Verrucomicrobiota bacterium]